MAVCTQMVKSSRASPSPSPPSALTPNGSCKTPKAPKSVRIAADLPTRGPRGASAEHDTRHAFSPQQTPEWPVEEASASVGASPFSEAATSESATGVACSVGGATDVDARLRTRGASESERGALAEEEEWRNADEWRVSLGSSTGVEEREPRRASSDQLEMAVRFNKANRLCNLATALEAAAASAADTATRARAEAEQVRDR